MNQLLISDVSCSTFNTFCICFLICNEILGFTRSNQMFGSSHIFVFWFWADSYQKTKISAVNFFMFTFCWGNKFLIGQSTKTFLVKIGFEELKKKVNKLDGFNHNRTKTFFGLLESIKLHNHEIITYYYILTKSASKGQISS